MQSGPWDTEPAELPQSDANVNAEMPRFLMPRPRLNIVQFTHGMFVNMGYLASLWFIIVPFVTTLSVWAQVPIFLFLGVSALYSLFTMTVIIRVFSGKF